VLYIPRDALRVPLLGGVGSTQLRIRSVGVSRIPALNNPARLAFPAVKSPQGMPHY
jgi:hypothetical protein